MTTEALKSTNITNLDASPVSALTTGEGGPGFLRAVNDTVTSTAGVTTGSTYRVARIPSNAKVKQVLLNTAAHGGSAAFDINVAYSDSGTDGSGQFGTGIVQLTGPVDNKLFGAAVAVSSAQTQKDITFQNTFTAAMQNLPLWQALVNLGAVDFTADPGGYFDILLKSTATDTSGGALTVEVDYVV